MNPKNRNAFFVIQIMALYIALVIWGLWLGSWCFVPGRWWHPGGLLAAASGWDGGWYLDIARHGYSWTSNSRLQQNVAFFPLYPLIERALHALGLSWSAAALYPSLLFTAAVVPAFYTLARRVIPETPAQIAAAAFLLYPGAQFYIADYPASLMNLIVILALLAVLKRRFWIAALLGGIGTAVGPLMVFLSTVIWVCYVKHLKAHTAASAKPWYMTWRWLALGTLSLSGILIYIAFLGLRFGDPLAFLQVQTAWGHAPLSLRLYRFITLYGALGGAYSPFLKSLTTLSGGQHFSAINASFEDFLNSAIFVCLLVSTLYGRRRLPAFLTGYAILVFLGYLWFMGSVQGTMSTVRLTYIAVPAFLGVGLLFERWPKVSITLLIFFALALIAQLAVFSAGYWVV